MATPELHPTDHYLLTPIYSVAEAARILKMPPRSLRNWTVDDNTRRPLVVRRSSRRPTGPLVTVAPHRAGSRATVPFIGLAEAHTLLAFRAAGVPIQRIRPAISWLKEHLGLMKALASERLMTDGAEVLYDFAARTDDAEAREAVDGLVVVRSGQQVFRPVVRDHLSRVEYREGWISLIHLPCFKGVDISVDPQINGGRPTIRRRGVPLDIVFNRLRGGEPIVEIAADYHLTHAEVSAIKMAA